MYKRFILEVPDRKAAFQFIHKITTIFEYQSIMKQYITDPKHLLDQIWQDKEINIVERENKLGRSKFCLIDFSINAYGQDEDKKYLCSSFYRANIRRGNTLVEDLNRKNKIYWARKGTPKILDIKLQYIRFFLKKLELKKQERSTAQIIFQGVNKAFRQGKRVQLIKIQKVNGENAQVSYNYDFDAWVICSKNVSLLANSLKDLDRYTENRYKYAINIAEQWFAEISHLDKDEINQLKKILNGYTIVGQYCGNPQFQHLVKYDQVCIKWFAMIDNYSEEYCLDPFQMKKQLQRFKFKIAKIKNIIIGSNSEQFYNSLENLYLKTAQAGLEDEEYGMEGSIVYFTVQEMKDKNSVRAIAVGAGKLKTLEYRYFRKIREKLSRFIAHKESAEQLLTKYKNQIKQLQSDSESHTIFPHDYYIKILKNGIELAQSSKIKEQQLRGKFINILKVIFYATYKKISLKKNGRNMLRDQNFIEKVSEIPFIKYNGLGCQTKIIYIVLCLPGMFKSYLAKKITPHFKRIQIPYQILNFADKDENIEHIETLCKANQSSALEHYFLDGSFYSSSIFKIVNEIKKSGDKNCYHKFVLIKDQAGQTQNFEGDDYNQYPFRLQTIIMCYLGQHQHKINSLTIQQKIENLKLVTEKLQKNANVLSSLKKLDISIYPYPFSKKCKIENLKQFETIIKTILSTEDEKISYTQYCLLILRLEKIQGIQYLDEQAIDNEVKHLIRSSYPSIPIMHYKGNQDL